MSESSLNYCKYFILYFELGFCPCEKDMIMEKPRQIPATEVVFSFEFFSTVRRTSKALKSGHSTIIHEVPFLR